MTLDSSKNLGGVGALLMFISVLLGYLPYLGALTGIISLVGAILVLVALKGFADYYRESRIFNNALYGIIVAVVGAVVFIAILLTSAVALFAALGLDITNIQDWTSLSQIDWQSIDLNLIFRFAGVVLLALIVLFIVLLVVAIFLRRSLRLMATKTNVGLFGTTGLLILIGAVLTIIAIGFLLIWIALLLLAIAFFSIQTPAVPPSQAQV
jgi:uncharacterized membrane protein